MQLSFWIVFIIKRIMKHKTQIIPQHKKRLETLGSLLRELRFAEGKNQDEFIQYGISRRQVQRGEYAVNMSLVSLFRLLDCYGYRLHEFFEGME